MKLNCISFPFQYLTSIIVQCTLYSAVFKHCSESEYGAVAHNSDAVTSITVHYSVVYSTAQNQNIGLQLMILLLLLASLYSTVRRTAKLRIRISEYGSIAHIPIYDQHHCAVQCSVQHCLESEYWSVAHDSIIITCITVQYSTAYSNAPNQNIRIWVCSSYSDV